MQKDFLSEIGKASGFINSTAQNFSDLGSFWVFCQCLHFILKVFPMTAAISNGYSMHTFVFISIWMKKMDF